MEYYGELELSAHPLTKAIEKNDGNFDELIALADRDLSLVIKKLPVGKARAGALEIQQEQILSHRLGYSPPQRMKTAHALNQENHSALHGFVAHGHRVSP